ncbi:hypothetical protein KIN20_023303 [Parelaphostrongylus tenuis]|uniref:Uncharacterized protein n=1 Tax=Parelaphostrongylus tenuis TaxID=148309 RepID=A0AAD5QSU9_PARTN|nr:hypothetical protein KIN20_023303 [Parelaphostrongylus tenuis]
MASAKSVDTAQAMLEEVGRLTAAVKSIETADEMLEEEVKPLTVTEPLTACTSILFTNHEYLLLIPDKYCHEQNSEIAVSDTEVQTAHSDYIYSEYSLPPSNTDVKSSGFLLLVSVSFIFEPPFKLM